jgi:hypothetical protein
VCLSDGVSLVLRAWSLRIWLWVDQRLGYGSGAAVGPDRTDPMTAEPLPGSILGPISVNLRPMSRTQDVVVSQPVAPDGPQDVGELHQSNSTGVNACHQDFPKPLIRGASRVSEHGGSMMEVPIDPGPPMDCCSIDWVCCGANAR